MAILLLALIDFSLSKERMFGHKVVVDLRVQRGGDDLSILQIYLDLSTWYKVGLLKEEGFAFLHHDSGSNLCLLRDDELSSVRDLLRLVLDRVTDDSSCEGTCCSHVVISFVCAAGFEGLSKLLITLYDPFLLEV